MSMLADLQDVVDDTAAEIIALRAELVDEHRRRGKPQSMEQQREWCRVEVQRMVAQLETKRLENNEDGLTDQEMDFLMREILDRVFGGTKLLGVWRSFDQATNLTVSGGSHARIELGDGSVIEGPKVAADNDELVAQVRQLSGLHGIKEVTWDINEPELELVTPEGDRITATWWSTDEVFVALRRPTLAKVTFEDLVGNSTMTPRCASLLKAVIATQKRFVVSGAMNTGKTVMLRAMASTMPQNAHLVTVESQRELLLHRFPELYPRWTTAMEARRANSEGVGEITMAQLITSIQRMSPTCVLVGEIRGPEAVPFISALAQGYSVGATVHGNSSLEALYGLAQYLEQHSESSYEAGLRRIATFIDVVVHMGFDQGRRIVESIRLVDGFEEGKVQSRELWGRSARTGMVQQSEDRPSKFYQEMTEHGGFDQTADDGGGVA